LRASSRCRRASAWAASAARTRSAIACVARQSPIAAQFRISETSCGERATASGNAGASAAISSSPITRQKLKRPWKPNGLPAG
jgi:hypothetical protein